jgi:hypothetical protein
VRCQAGKREERKVFHLDFEEVVTVGTSKTSPGQDAIFASREEVSRGRQEMDWLRMRRILSHSGKLTSLQRTRAFIYFSPLLRSFHWTLAIGMVKALGIEKDGLNLEDIAAEACACQQCEVINHSSPMRKHSHQVQLSSARLRVYRAAHC